MNQNAPDTPDTTELLRRARFAELLAHQAGSIIRAHYYSSRFSVDTKEDGSPVTDADRNAEEFLREQIARAFPEDAIVGEEHGESSGSNDFTWVLDPVDGTKSFIAGVPLFTTLISLLHKQIPYTGIIHNPITMETVSATTGHGCTFNGNHARIRECQGLSDALVLVTDPADFFRRQPDFAQAVSENSGEMRTWADGYGYLMLATGRADAMFDPIMNLWDIAPMYPIVSEAGARITDFSGEETALGSSALAAAPAVHSQLLSLLLNR